MTAADVVLIVFLLGLVASGLWIDLGGVKVDSGEARRLVAELDAARQEIARRDERQRILRDVVDELSNKLKTAEIVRDQASEAWTTAVEERDEAKSQANAVMARVKHLEGQLAKAAAEKSEVCQELARCRQVGREEIERLSDIWSKVVRGETA